MIMALSLPAVSEAGRTLNDEQLRTLAPKPLSTVPIPEPPNLSEFVVDRKAAIALGKALFWDMQVGSDGIQSCATCHFHAGADSRSRNQLNPGSNTQTGADPNQFDWTLSGGGGPNYTLKKEDFPFSKWFDDVASSQGVYNSKFLGVWAGRDKDRVEFLDDIFNVGGITVRRVEPRNSPTVINAVFNHRNFWDGRASHIFNGLDPFGVRTNNAFPLNGPNPKGIWVMQSNGSLVLQQIALENCSLASQATGPPLSDFEMSAAGRDFPAIGYKMLRLRPLQKQAVDKNDSVLGVYRHSSGKGLNISYSSLIAKAFARKYWASPKFIKGVYRQREMNFSLFFGLAVQMYESTLVSGNTRFDRFVKGYDYALTSQEKLGLEVFLTKGKCINCHAGSEFTGASVRMRHKEPEAVERMFMGNGLPALYDGGFYNIGVRNTLEDAGVGGLDPYGNPLSFSRQLTEGPLIDPFNFDPSRFEVPGPIVPGERVAVDGAFKVPTIRNVALTGPYFHNGGQATLEQVTEFYDRGGDFPDENRDNLDPDIGQIGFTPEEETALVAFMKALTDDRVTYEREPFDHPELKIPNGAKGDEFIVEAGADGNGIDEFINIPAIGRGGRTSPLKNFLE